MKLAPQAVAARKKLARRDQRVEARREASGNASLSGRELDTADVMASKAYIDAIAVKLRDSGLIPGTLGQLRALALTDLTQGRDPLDRIKPRQTPADEVDGRSGPAARQGGEHLPPLTRRRCPRLSTSWSRPARPSAGAPPPRKRQAGDCWTRRRSKRFSGLRLSTREPAGASPSPPQTAPPSPTPAPRGGIPGNLPAHRAANSAEILAAPRHHSRQLSWRTCYTPSASPSSQSPGTPAITGTPKTATYPVASSGTCSVPATRHAPHPRAMPRPCLATSTTRSRTPMAPRTSAT